MSGTGVSLRGDGNYTEMKRILGLNGKQSADARSIRSRFDYYSRLYEKRKNF